MEKILFLAFVLYVVQCFFMYLQMKHFKSIVKDFMTKGHVGIGERKSKFSAGNVVVLVSDDNGMILEAKQMKGRTLLARFKSMGVWKGKNINFLKQTALKEKKQNKALLQAIDSIVVKKDLV
ncbi:transcriptional regulator GutM [Pectinatus sottacetonis]|uniref:transcriptional regulator GutM n=1 Tax=Pectinatus sottacetonis TaxID=1002795 RepID=UPI0018C4E9D1|nr:transcriptional regulator GutM [Pectinatus sottacetonis]